MESYKTKTSMVYDYIKEHILNGKYPPGERINPKELSLQLSVSPVPVREAINKLASDGLVKLTPHVGASVANINKGEFEEILMIRTELECYAARLSSNYLTDEHLDRLEKIIKDSEEAIQAGRYEKFRKLNKQFHLGIYKDLPYQILLKIIMDLYEKLRLVSTYPWTKEQAEHNLNEHKLLLKTLRGRNGTSVSRILRKHRTTSRHVLRELEGNRRKAI